MKVSPRENLLSLYRRRGYEAAPVEIMLCPAQLRRFEQKTGRAAQALDDYLGVPFRKIPGPRVITPNRSVYMRELLRS